MSQERLRRLSITIGTGPQTQSSHSQSQSPIHSINTSETSWTSEDSFSSGSYTDEETEYARVREARTEATSSRPAPAFAPEVKPASRPSGARRHTGEGRPTAHIHVRHKSSRRGPAPSESTVEEIDHSGRGRGFVGRPHHYDMGARALSYQAIPAAFTPNPFIAPNPPAMNPPGRFDRYGESAGYVGHAGHAYAPLGPGHDPRMSQYHGMGPPVPSPYGHEMMPYGVRDPGYGYPNPYQMNPYFHTYARPVTAEDREVVAPVKVPTPQPVVVVDPVMEARTRELEATLKALTDLNNARDAKEAASAAAARKRREDELNETLLRLTLENEEAKKKLEKEESVRKAAKIAAAAKAEIDRTVAEELMKAKIAFEAAALKAKQDEDAAAKAAADAKKAAEDSYKAAFKEAEEKLKADAAVAAVKAAEEEAKKPPPPPAPAPDKKKPIKFKDAVGRKFSFPFHLCATWAGMEDLILQAFLHVDKIGDHVAAGHYDLVGPNGEIILPQVWETMIEPDWSVTMHLWPMPEPPPPEILLPLPHGAKPKHPPGKRPKNPGAIPVPPPAPGGFGGGGAPMPPGFMESPAEVLIVKKKPTKKAAGGFWGNILGPPPKKPKKKAAK